ncbi:MAG: ATP-binding cassette domain-containing protein [Firmicutes bacterium]|nr:ATP-binding cassette domain-containing protein [Bacillota bacterium]
MLKLQNISFNVSGKQILADVNLTVERGRFTVLTGPNGGGKSSLAKIIMGIESPTAGRILFEGRDITDLGVTERAKQGIGFAFQSPVRFKGLFVKDLLRFAAGKELSYEEACAYLSEVGLCANGYIGREVNASLSGGELKRIEIAMLMARGVKLSVFDEPEAGIDLWSFTNLIRVFQKLRAKNDGAVVIISHQERILDIADQIVVISSGRITGEGSKDAMLPKIMDRQGTCEFFR